MRPHVLHELCRPFEPMRLAGRFMRVDRRGRNVDLVFQHSSNIAAEGTLHAAVGRHSFLKQAFERLQCV